MIPIKLCPYLESCFDILGRRWNGLIVHYLFQSPNYEAQFSKIKNDLATITPRALSLKLTELSDFELVEKKVTSTTPITISYTLTPKGVELAKALQPVHEWATRYIQLEEKK